MLKKIFSQKKNRKMKAALVQLPEEIARSNARQEAA